MSERPPVSRRSFLVSAASAGGSLALGFDIPFGPSPAAAAAAAPEITAWIVIGPDDSVIIRVAKSEMGQGAFTALPMLVAEELECDWSKVKAEFAAPQDNLRRKRVWGDMSTGGSRSIRTSHEHLRKAGATAREMLIAAAAAEWNVPASECRAARSVITHEPSGRTVSYGKVARSAARMAPPKTVTLKNPKDWKLAGKPTNRLDVIDKVQGKPIYGIDVRLPDMLYAAVIQSPVFRGKLTSLGQTKLAGMRGIHKVVRLDDAVAVIADSWWRAKKAVEALDPVWDDGGNGGVTSAGIADFVRTGLSDGKAGIGRKDGDAALGLTRAARRVEADYAVPFLGHATLEPQNCTAHVTGGKVEIWAPTQNGEAALVSAAAAAGVPTSNVTVHKCMLGGGFGRRGVVQDFVTLAVKIAKEVDRPVKVLWSREEDMRHDFYRPVAMARMKAGLDGSGAPVAWHVRMTGQSILGSLQPITIRSGLDRHFQEGFLQDMPYDVPNYLADYAIRMTHVPVGFWRCVNHTQNCFFKESFIDELAHAAGAGSLPVPAPPARQASARQGTDRRARRRGPQGRMGNAAAGWRRARHRAQRSLWHLQRGGDRGLGRSARRCARAPRRLRHRPRTRDQPAHRRDAGRKRRGVRADRRTLWRDHAQGRPRRAVEFPRLPHAAHAGDAEGRDHRDAVGRLLERRRRAAGRAGGAGALQRHLCGDRQAHPLASARRITS